jgi:hypothetical protein
MLPSREDFVQNHHTSDLRGGCPDPLDDAKDNQRFEIPCQPAADRRGHSCHQSCQIEGAIAYQAAKPAERRHRYRARNLKAGHDPVNIGHVSTHGAHDFRQGNDDGKHAEGQCDLAHEDRQGESPAGAR